MSKHLNVLRATMAAIVLAAPAIAQQQPDADTVVATVAGQEITLGHMIMTREALPEQYQALGDDVLFQGILDQLTQQALLAQTVTATPHRVQIALQNERRRMLATEAIAALLEDGISDEDIATAYEARVKDFQGPTEYNASHILVETEEEALAIRAELEAGADFAETAKAKSTGPSGPSGGELGWFGAGMMVKPFEDAVAGMSVGEISAPVQTQFGWHLIILNETRQQEKPALEELAGELRAELEEAALDAHIASLSQANPVETKDVEGLDPAMIRRVDLLTADPVEN